MKTSKNHRTISKLVDLYDAKKLNFDWVIQRQSNIWDDKRKSILIHSVLVGYPIPSVFAAKNENTYYYLDGKQRLLSLISYVKGEYALALDSSISEVDGFEIAKKTFSELREDLKERINNYQVETITIEDVTAEQMEQIFYRLNNGVPLRQIESTRAILGSTELKFVQDIAKMDFFKEKVNLSQSARQRYVDQEMILQILALVYDGETGFSSKDIQEFAKKLRNEGIRKDLLSKLQNAFFYLNRAFTEKKTFLKKLHVPMLVKLVLELQERNSAVTDKEFGEWAEHFFAEGNTPTEYIEACKSGSATKPKVQRRLAVMREAMNAYFEKKAQTQTAGAQEEVAASVEAMEGNNANEEAN